MVATADRLRALDELCGQGVRGRHEAAQPQAGEEPEQAEHLGAGRKAHSAVKSENHRWTTRWSGAAEAVRESPRGEGAEEHAGESQAADVPALEAVRSHPGSFRRCGMVVP